MPASDPEHRDPVRELLEREDMMKRRAKLDILSVSCTMYAPLVRNMHQFLTCFIGGKLNAVTTKKNFWWFWANASLNFEVFST